MADPVPGSRFRQVNPDLIDGSIIEGEWVVIIDPPHDIERAQHARALLRMVFTTGRIQPHHLRIVNVADRANRDPDAPQQSLPDEAGLQYMWRILPPYDPTDGGARDAWDTGPNTTVYEALIDADRPVAITWLEPAEGARLVAVGRAELSSPEHADVVAADAPPFDGQHSDLAGFQAAVGSIARDPARTPEQRKAAHFWLTLDLTTSLADPQRDREQIAKAVGIPPALISVDPTRRKWLAELLQTRWLARANCAAAGAPFDLLFGGVPGEAYALSKQVADLVLALMHNVFGDDLRAAWQPVVEFACGSLRRPRVGQRLNVEPNSMAMAAFAEVIDFASMDAQNGNAERYRELRLLRKMFVSIIEPFTDNYHERGRPQLADYYGYTNLGAEPGSVARGAWTPKRVEQHIAMIEALDYEALTLYWGGRLATALCAEASVQNSAAWGKRFVRPLDSAALGEAKRVVERALDKQREADAGA